MASAYLLLLEVPSSLPERLLTSDLSRRVTSTIGMRLKESQLVLLFPLLLAFSQRLRRTVLGQLVTLDLTPPPLRIWMAMLVSRCGPRVATKDRRTVHQGFSRPV